MDPFAEFKDAQRQGWSHFAPTAAFRGEYEGIVAEYLKENVVHQGFLLTRATKV